jgi:transposase-like protein
MTTDVGSFKSYQLSDGRTTPVSVRVSPTEKIRAEIDALFDGSRELGEVIEDVARLGARLIIQTAMEAEVEVFLGRARYQRAATVEDARAGSRNGYCPATVKTTAGPITVARPKLRGTTEAFASSLFGKSVTKSNALESLVIAGFVRGLSVRDVENTLADALGAEATLSKSTVSRVCQAISGELAAWSFRRLDELALDYLFLDASMFKMHPGARAEPVLAAWGITTDGAPVFVALAAGGSESTDAWGDFLDELTGRGLRPPLLVISDGAAGLINAAESSLPRSLRQRCLIHRCRNLLAKVPAKTQSEVRDAYWAIFDTDTLIAAGLQPGSKLVAAVQVRIDAFAETYRGAYPSAVKCLLTERGTAHQLPALPARASPPDPALQLHRTHLRRDPPPRQGHRPAAQRGQLPQPRLGRPRPCQPRLARDDDDTDRDQNAQRSASPTTRPANPDPPTRHHQDHRGNCWSRRLTSTPKEPSPHHLHRSWDATSRHLSRSVTLAFGRHPRHTAASGRSE